MIEFLNRPDEVSKSIESYYIYFISQSRSLEEHIKNWYANIWYPTTENNFSVGKRDRKQYGQIGSGVKILKGKNEDN